ncbi:type II secretion system F family protein [Actinobacillus delphinicola]|uniref:Type II secretion system protein n=1 Tax=Actinobacillus delphinicola TaxID=51161 RepID=A0A448TTI7_9PAST|nr:type II secretion system F family protein [Actinobacillus delphinicola]VEJ09215.1 type II secretion system protein [Actinobacillus delphinicola]
MKSQPHLHSFRWQGVNPFQEKEHGEIIAQNKSIAQKQLLQRGLKHLSIQKNWQLNTAPSQQIIYQFFAQLAVLLKANIPIKIALQITLQDCTNIALYRWISALITLLNQGYSLSYAMTKENKYLTFQELSLIKVGEMTGNMPHLCNKIAENQKQRLSIQRKIQKIMLYPSLVLGVSCLLTLLLLIFIVPQFAQMYANHQQTLPLFTQILLIISQFIRTQGIYWISIFIALFSFTKYFFPQIFHRLRQQLRNQTPFFSRFNRLNRQYHISQNLSLMLKAGIPLNEALRCFIQAERTSIQDPILKKSIEKTCKALMQGYAFSTSLSTQLFSAQAKHMIQLGEKTGSLPLMLEKIAENTQEKLDHEIALISQLIEPVMMVIIGILIGSIMLGLYLPIFNMGSLIQG